MDIKNLTDQEKQFIENIIAASFVYKGIRWEFLKHKKEMITKIDGHFKISVCFVHMDSTFCVLSIYDFHQSTDTMDVMVFTADNNKEYFEQFSKIFQTTKDKYKKNIVVPAIEAMNTYLDKILKTEHTNNFPPPTPPLT